MDLGGAWRAAAGDDDLRRAFPEPGFDDVSWETLPVPGHWRSTPSFAGCDGPVLYRRPFAAPAPADERRAWLTFDGLFYQGDVWLDGAYVGDTEGYFFPHTFEVTDALRQQSEHVLAVELSCSPQHDKAAKRNITGVFQHWDCLDPAWNPGGIWRPVRIEETGPVRINRLRVRCTEATERRAVVRFRAELDTVEARPVRIATTVGASDHEAERPLAAGANRIEWDVVIDQPALWWPHALGGQPLHDVTVRVGLPGGDDDHAVSDERRLQIGLRRVELRNWVCSVNGERLFLKGSNYAPTRMALADASPDEMARDVQLARDAGLDLLRVHAHVSRPDLYDAADRAGLLLWQDFPLQWGYARGLRKQAARQAREMVDLLAHHPSIAVWCGHNEPMAIEDTDVPTELGPLLKLGARMVAAQELPTWNKTVLDRSIKRAIDKADGTRPVIPHSGVWPHLPQLDGTDSHLYFGWYHGHERDLPTAARLAPRLMRFVTEFGAQAVPPTADFIDADRWPDLDWELLGARHALQKSLFDRHVPPADYATFDEWREATQRYQATVVRHHIETLRRLKYRPTGGFCQFMFSDCYPSVTWSVLDHERAPKLGYEALAAACRPVLIVADRLPETVRASDALALDVHVISDLREPLTAARCTATLAWAGGEHHWGWEGDVPADGCVRVGTLQVIVPDVEGALRLDLELAAGDVKATNSYGCQISPPTPAE